MAGTCDCFFRSTGTETTSCMPVLETVQADTAIRTSVALTVCLGWVAYKRLRCDLPFHEVEILFRVEIKEVSAQPPGVRSEEMTCALH